MNEPRFEHWVQLAGRRVRHRDVRAEPGRYATLLAHARHDHGATCLCRPTPLPLVVRLTRSGRLTLACWPNQGQRHHPQCAFHHLAPALSGRSGYTAAAITETADATTIRFSEPLTSNQKAPKHPQRRHRGAHLPPQRRTARAAALPVGSGTAQRLEPGGAAPEMAGPPARRRIRRMRDQRTTRA